MRPEECEFRSEREDELPGCSRRSGNKTTWPYCQRDGCPRKSIEWPDPVDAWIEAAVVTIEASPIALQNKPFPWATNRTAHTSHLGLRRSVSCVACLLAEVATLKAERDKARADYQFMVDRAVDEKLDGYQEMGAKLVDREERIDCLRAEVAAANELAAELRDTAVSLKAEVADLKAERDGALIKEDWAIAIEAERDKLKAERDALKDKATYAKKRYQDFPKRWAALEAERDDLRATVTRQRKLLEKACCSGAGLPGFLIYQIREELDR